MGKVLITGAGGFIGSHLAERCVESGFSVKAFVHYNSRNSWGWLDDSPLRNDMEIITGDIRDYDSVSRAINGCSAVFHLAALIGIPYSYVSPMAYIKTNIEGTYNVLETSRVGSVENILITSTSETYGSAQYVPMNESHPSVGQSPYSASKIGADQLAVSYYRSFQLPVKIVRPFNTYGPRQSARAIIPTIVAQIASGAKEIRLGNLSPTRDLTFVKDTVEGFIEIFKSKSLYGEATNIGMKDEISVGDLVKKIADIMNANVSIVSERQRVRPGESEVERLCCDNSKIMKHTEWKPAYTLDSGLAESVIWIKENISNFKPGIYNV